MSGEGGDARAGLHVWVTRAQPGAGQTAQRLVALGHTPLVAPVLDVVLTEAPAPDLKVFDAIAFTSANAVRAFAGRCAGRSWPVFAVGDATARAAQDAGFVQVRSAQDDVAALAALIATPAYGAGSVLHPCAVEPAGDLAGVSRAFGVTVAPWPLYRTCIAEGVRHGIDEILQDRRPDRLLVHSPRGAEALAGLFATPARRGRASGLIVAALSPACAAPLAASGFARIDVAARPNDPALLATLEAARCKGRVP